MAHFYGSMQGGRGETTRTGTKNSGLSAHIRGWNVGVLVDVKHVDGKDIIEVRRTGGSNNPNSQPWKFSGNSEPVIISYVVD